MPWPCATPSSLTVSLDSKHLSGNQHAGCCWHHQILACWWWCAHAASLHGCSSDSARCQGEAAVIRQLASTSSRHLKSGRGAQADKATLQGRRRLSPYATRQSLLTSLPSWWLPRQALCPVQALHCYSCYSGFAYAVQSCVHSVHQKANAPLALQSLRLMHVAMGAQVFGFFFHKRTSTTIFVQEQVR